MNTLRKVVIIKEETVCQNAVSVHVATGNDGYILDFACSLGELRNITKDYPDNSLVQVVSFRDDRSAVEDQGSLCIMEIEEETTDAYNARIELQKENQRKADEEKEKKQKEYYLQQYNLYKDKLGL